MLNESTSAQETDQRGCSIGEKEKAKSSKRAGSWVGLSQRGYIAQKRGQELSRAKYSYLVSLGLYMQHKFGCSREVRQQNYLWMTVWRCFSPSRVSFRWYQVALLNTRNVTRPHSFNHMQRTQEWIKQRKHGHQHVTIPKQNNQQKYTSCIISCLSYIHRHTRRGNRLWLEFLSCHRVERRWVLWQLGMWWRVG